MSAPVTTVSTTEVQVIAPWVKTPDVSSGTRQRRAEAHAGVVLATPAALLLLALVIGPSLAAIGLSFTDYRLGFENLSLIGLGNYTELVADPVFRTSLRNSFIYAALVVPASVGLGLLVALLIEGRGMLRGFYRTAYFLPVASTMVAMATVWEFMFLPGIGLVNQLLALVGVSDINFLGDPSVALVAVAAISVWELVGFNMVLFMAGLAAIPRDLYQAAAVDGVDGPWERFRTVTWPLLGPTTMFVLVITAIRALRVFDTVALLTKGGPNRSTEVVLYTIYVNAFEFFRVGYAAAMTVVFLLLVILLTLAQARVIERRVHYA